MFRSVVSRQFVQLATQTGRPLRSQNYSTSRMACTVEVSAAMVKELRGLSGAPLLDCRQALAQDNVSGDMQKALDWLRARGLKKMAQSQRTTNEGLIGVHLRDHQATLVEVNCETDFVGMNQDFQRFVASVCGTVDAQTASALERPGEEILKLSLGESSVERALGDIVSSIRETIVVKRSATLLAPSTEGSVDVFAAYVHGKVGIDVVQPPVQLGKAASVVHLSAKVPASLSTAQITDLQVALREQVGRKLAMHIVAAKPLYLEPSVVPKEVVDHEMTIFREQMKDEKKKESVLENILKGKLSKRLNELCLVGQNHLAEEGNPVVNKHLDAIASKLGVEKISVKNFVLWKKQHALQGDQCVHPTEVLALLAYCAKDLMLSLKCLTRFLHLIAQAIELPILPQDCSLDLSGLKRGATIGNISYRQRQGSSGSNLYVDIPSGCFQVIQKGIGFGHSSVGGRHPLLSHRTTTFISQLLPTRLLQSLTGNLLILVVNAARAKKEAECSPVCSLSSLLGLHLAGWRSSSISGNLVN
eukprot:gene9002-9936_t